MSTIVKIDVYFLDNNIAAIEEITENISSW